MKQCSGRTRRTSSRRSTQEEAQSDRGSSGLFLPHHPLSLLSSSFFLSSFLFATNHWATPSIENRFLTFLSLYSSHLSSSFLLLLLTTYPPTYMFHDALSSPPPPRSPVPPFFSLPYCTCENLFFDYLLFPYIHSFDTPTLSQRANILKEVSIMRGLNHPSIVRLLNFTESREHYFLTLEYVISYLVLRKKGSSTD